MTSTANLQLKAQLKSDLSKYQVPLPEKEKPFRLGGLSYNIHHARWVDRQLNIARIANVILSVKPDLIALQEVDRDFVIIRQALYLA